MSGNMALINSMQVGVDAALKNTYKRKIVVLQKQQNALLKFVPHNDAIETKYAFKEATPSFQRWPDGKKRTFQAIKDRIITAGLINFDLTMSWSVRQGRHDLIEDPKDHAVAGVQSAFQVLDKMPIEYFNGVPDLNKKIQNCYDGNPLFSDSSSRAEIMGVTGGNIVTGSGKNQQAVFKGLEAVQQRLFDSRDNAGKVFWDEDQIDFTRMIVLAPSSWNGIMNGCAERVLAQVSSTGLQSESNYLAGKFKYHINPYLTNQNDWYVIIEDPDLKPFIARAMENLETFFGVPGQSDIATLENKAYVSSSFEATVAPFAFHSIIKVSNS